MAISQAPAALQRFVDDELMRTPLLVDQVIEGAVDHIRKGMAGMLPHDRAIAGDLLQSVLGHRQHVVDYYLKSLREQVMAELGRTPAQSAAQPAAQPAAPPKASALSLVDEDEVAVDVEISHTIEAIRSVAEYELRELQTFVSALVGDMDVARDHNPFRAEAHARALWHSAQALPLSRGYQVTYMRHASMPLAQVLRKTYAGASSRLEATGIEPASHRTLILPAGSRRPRPENTFVPDLYRIRDSMPVHEHPPAPPLALEQVLQQADAQWRKLAPDTGSGERDVLRDRQRAQLLSSANDKADQQAIELVSRLFDALVGDRDLPPDIQLLLARLQAPALRMALRDPKTLDKDNHALWQFMDRFAFLGETLPEPGDARRAQALRLVQGVIEHVAAEPEQSAALYVWALTRLNGQEQHRFEQRCKAAAPEIELLQPLEDRLAASQAPPTTLHGALDLAQLDTVPAELIDHDAAPRKPAPAAKSWLDQRRAGHWVRMFMQGRWVHAQLLWPGERGELWLFADGASDTTWAVRRRALLTLHGEHLLDTLQPRSLVRDAAKTVMRRLARER
jgi:hypothetical protein